VSGFTVPLPKASWFPCFVFLIAGLLQFIAFLPIFLLFPGILQSYGYHLMCNSKYGFENEMKFDAAFI